MNRRLGVWIRALFLGAWVVALFPGSPARATDANPDASDEDEYAVPQVRDPWETFNRSMFHFNDTVYSHVVRPISRGYATVVPAPVRRGLGSFFENARFPIRFVSCVLQGKLDRSAAEAGKFLVNTTAGVGGFIKVSDRFARLRVPEEDTGQAFGSWGIGPGPYIVLPLFGPTTTRDLFGSAGDYLLTPVNWHFMEKYGWEVRDGLIILDAVNNTPDLVKSYDSFRNSALDPYIAFRNGYLQYREAAIKR